MMLKRKSKEDLSNFILHLFLAVQYMPTDNLYDIKHYSLVMFKQSTTLVITV